MSVSPVIWVSGGVTHSRSLSLSLSPAVRLSIDVVL
jgi:hypothetical protein